MRKPKPGPTKKLKKLCEAGAPCPPHLRGEARREWNWMAQFLFDAGLLTTVDRAALAAYCQAWGRWVKAEQELTKHGSVALTIHGTLKESPWVAIAKNAKEKLLEIAIRFGMRKS